ncbi:hypothetical protein PLICRDRAFT_163835 [Plicaturopsis crispa FD-325 SS-3]|nr:hypothetical protein PLICRDRAFT_163835 [Plicaturopsis crispa FD-325 SS-3]
MSTPESSSQTEVDSTGWSAKTYNKTASFVYSPAFTAPILDLLNAQPGERILDLGCGSGEVSIEIQKVVGSTGLVAGVDASESMIEKARANGLPNAFLCDAQALEFPDGFAAPTKGYDAVFTNATLHWCKRDPLGVLTGVSKVLKQGGRFVGEMGGFTNCIGVRSAIHHVLKQRGYDPEKLDPWFFPSVDEYSELLQAASFRPTHVSLTPRFTPLSTPGGLGDWIRLFVRSSFLKDFSDAEADSIIDEVVEACRVSCMDGNGKWAMIYTRLRFVAIWDGETAAA